MISLLWLADRPGRPKDNHGAFLDRPAPYAKPVSGPGSAWAKS